MVCRNAPYVARNWAFAVVFAVVAVGDVNGGERFG